MAQIATEEGFQLGRVRVEPIVQIGTQLIGERFDPLLMPAGEPTTDGALG